MLIADLKIEIVARRSLRGPLSYALRQGGMGRRARRGAEAMGTRAGGAAAI
jgi:hypothetical protein